jgi:EAL domain-containing protein (putative c-di-GMP-specific phosphodiesterase class I)
VINRIHASAEAASNKTLEAFAQVIRALAPEVTSLSFHDRGAETLWLSDNFLLPEDHKLVEDLLAANHDVAQQFEYGAREGHGYAVAVPVRAPHGGIIGALRLGIDSQIVDDRITESLESRLAPVLVCLAAEFERRSSLPLLPPEDLEQLAIIENALQAERFELFVQPICSLRSDGGLTHYEVLLRLRTSDGSLLEPAAFLRPAASNNLMPAIDRWVVRSLLVWLVNNRKRWARVPAVFAVNVAAQSMVDSDFLNYVEACVTKSGLPPQALCFEVSERSAAAGNVSLTESMKRLAALGCEVALDDFGANASSYGYLRDTPAHLFKIDSSLVAAAPRDRVAHARISAIVKMANDLGVRTVAESVESNSELAAVRSLGVDYAQGYLLGRPQALAGYDFKAELTN